MVGTWKFRFFFEVYPNEMSYSESSYLNSLDQISSNKNQIMVYTKDFDLNSIKGITNKFQFISVWFS